MDKKEFAVFAAALKTYYPKENLLPNTQAMELWFRQLQDIPYAVAEAALNKWVATEKWSPTIAELREMAAGITCGDIPDWSEAWQKVLDAIHYYGLYRISEAMETFDDLTYQCVKRLGFRNLCMSENISVERANFRMIYEQLAQRKKQELQMPEPLRLLIQTMQGVGIEAKQQRIESEVRK